MIRRRIAALAVLAAALPAPLLAQERWPISLYRDALKMETERTDLDNHVARAIPLYQKVIEKKDHPERGNLYAMLAHYHIGLCHEKLGNVEEALRAYQAIAAESWSDAAVAEHDAYKTAKDKIERHGVDVYLRQFCAAAAAWQLRPFDKQNMPEELRKTAQELQAKITAIDTKALYALRVGLDHPHPACRDFAAATLSLLADEQALKDLIDDLANASADRRAGAATALADILARIHEAAELDALAAEIERRLDRSTRSFKAGPPEKVPPEAQDIIAKVFAGQAESEQVARTEIEALRKRAKDLRNHLPQSVPADALVEALAKVIADPDPDARLEACRCAGVLADARSGEPLAQAIADADPVVRAAAVAACGLVRSRAAVAPLMEILKKDEPDDVADPDEDPGRLRPAGRSVPSAEVRRDAAEALGRIGDVTAIPALVDALTDNDTFVRVTAFRALRGMTNRRFTAKIPVRSGEQAVEVESEYAADLPLAVRAQIAGLWQAWYDETKAVDVLLDRYRALAFRWVDYNPVQLYDEELFLRRAGDRQITAEEGREFIAQYLAAVKQIEDDIQAVGPPAVPQLLKSVGGEEQDDPERRVPVVRRFVAGALARLADEGVIGQLTELANDAAAPPDRRTGAAIALGLLQNPPNPSAVSGALQGLLNVLDPAAGEMRAEAALALGRLNAADAAQTLITKTSDPDPAVVVAVLRTLAKFKSADAVPAVSDLLKNPDAVKAPTDDMQGLKDQALEFAAQALGDIGSPDGLPALVHARAHPRAPVRETAQRAIEAVVRQDKGSASRLLEWITGDNTGANPVRYKNQPLPYLRAYAVRALGDLPEDLRSPEIADAILHQILDKNFPREVREYDGEVRKAAVERLVKMKEPRGAAALVKSLRDGAGIPKADPRVLKAVQEQGVEANVEKLDDVRLIAAFGLEKIVDDPSKPAVWEPQDYQTPDEIARELKRWEKFAGDWEGWLARKEGRAVAAPPAGAGETPADAPPAEEKKPEETSAPPPPEEKKEEAPQ
jgi:HEAT repeat protein